MICSRGERHPSEVEDPDALPDASATRSLTPLRFAQDDRFIVQFFQRARGQA